MAFIVLAPHSPLVVIPTRRLECLQQDRQCREDVSQFVPVDQPDPLVNPAALAFNVG
jgi:hypothetical protein